MGQAKRRGTFEQRRAKAILIRRGLLMDEVKERPKEIGKAIWILGCELGHINYRVRDARLAEIESRSSRHRMNNIMLSALAIGGKFW